MAYCGVFVALWQISAATAKNICLCHYSYWAVSPFWINIMLGSFRPCSRIYMKNVISFYILPLTPLCRMYEFCKAWKWQPYFSLSALYPTVSCLWWIHLGLYPLKLDSQLWAITVRPVGPTVYSLSRSHPHCATPLQFLAWLGEYLLVKWKYAGRSCAHTSSILFLVHLFCNLSSCWQLTCLIRYKYNYTCPVGFFKLERCNKNVLNPSNATFFKSGEAGYHCCYWI